MVKRLRRVGNSLALILDRGVVEMIGLEDGGEVQLSVHNGSLIMTPANPKPVSPQRFDQLTSQVIAKRRSALRRLAE